MSLTFPFVAIGLGSVLGIHIFRRRLAISLTRRELKTSISDPSTADGITELEDIDLDVDGRISKDDIIKRSVLQISSEATEVPGSGRIFFRTFGCSHNVSDSEFMMGLLVKYGYTLVDSIEACDLCVLNSCTVKSPSQDAAVNLVARAEQLGKKIVVTGCVPQADQSIPFFEKASLVGVSNITAIVTVVEETLRGNRIVAIGKASDLPDINSMPKIRRNKLVEIIAISTGCLGQCTYCKTKHARGELGSYPISAIVERVQNAIGEGVKQIWLTSEDLGAYGIDIGTDIVKLLDAIVEVIENSNDKGIMLRLGMTNPPYMLQHADEVGRILSHPHVFSFLHIPIQSGSDQVLRAMRREYERADFELLVEKLRAIVPSVSIATDIICGFPGESEEDHNDTITLINQHKFPVINISQFYPRPGTPAAHMQRVPTKIAKARSTEVTNVFESYTTNEAFLGQEIDVWFDLADDSAKHKQSVGHSKNYTKVLVDLRPNVAGRIGRVLVTSVHKWDVRGELISLE